MEQISWAVARFERAIAKWGSPVILAEAGEGFRAVIQPDWNRTRKYLEGDYTPFGRAERGRWLYRGPVTGPGGAVREGCILKSPKAAYRVIATADYELAGVPVYRSGWLEALQPGGGA